MGRKYELKHRAQRMEETRRRIVEATVALHEELGPAHTTISAIAERAGVERLTVYRHFPDEDSLFDACTSEYWRAHPFPDPDSWAPIGSPLERLRRALAALYAYYGETEEMTLKSLRDLPLKPALARAVSKRAAHWQRIHETLAAGWDVPADRRRMVEAAIGLAVDFRTWHTLVRQRGLTDDEAVDLMAASVCAAASGMPAAQGAGR